MSNSVSNQIVFTGTDFFTSGYAVNASYSGIPADTVVVDSATQVTATWTMGIPPLSSAVVPKLWFNSTGSDYRLINAANLNSLNLTLAVTSSSVDNGCSFAGGCAL